VAARDFLKKAGFALMALMALALLWVRAAYPSWIPFIADEPLFQMILDDHIKAGTFPLVSMRGSSIPLAYGAGAMWIYGLIRLFFSSIEAMAFFHGLVYSLGLISIAFLLKGRVANGRVLLITWLALSAPMLFFFSRLLWDNTFFVPLSALLLLCLDHIDRRNPASVWAWVGLGAVAGYMLNIHLMVAPILLAAGLTALILALRSELPRRRSLAFVGLALFIFVLMVAPYLWQAVSLYFSEGVAAKSGKRTLWGDGRNLWWLIQRSFVYLSFWKANDLYGQVFADFRQFSGSVLSAFFAKDVLGWFPKLLALGYVLSLPVKLWRTKRLDSVQWMLLLTFVIALFSFNLLNIPMEAHYFHGMWWLGFLALALGLESLRGRVRQVFTSLVAVCALLNTAYVLQSARFVHEHEGMRNFTYGTTMREIRATLGDVCSREAGSEARIYLDGVILLKHPVRYFNHHLPACEGKELRLVASPAEANWVLKYRNPNPSAALLAEPVNP
jgi:hypothetical protein